MHQLPWRWRSWRSEWRERRKTEKEEGIVRENAATVTWNWKSLTDNREKVADKEPSWWRHQRGTPMTLSRVPSVPWNQSECASWSHYSWTMRTHIQRNSQVASLFKGTNIPKKQHVLLFILYTASDLPDMQIYVQEPLSTSYIRTYSFDFSTILTNKRCPSRLMNSWAKVTSVETPASSFSESQRTPASELWIPLYKSSAQRPWVHRDKWHTRSLTVQKNVLLIHNSLKVCYFQLLIWIRVNSITITATKCFHHLFIGPAQQLKGISSLSLNQRSWRCYLAARLIQYGYTRSLVELRLQLNSAI